MPTETKERAYTKQASRHTDSSMYHMIEVKSKMTVSTGAGKKMKESFTAGEIYIATKSVNGVYSVDTNNGALRTFSRDEDFYAQFEEVN